MEQYSKRYLFLAVMLVSCTCIVFTQELIPFNLSMEKAISLGLQNHQALKIARSKVEAGKQQVSVTKTQQLPSISLSANAFYLGDALVLDKDWTKVQSVEMPHFGNTYGVQAAQLLYKGGAIKRLIELAKLQEQLSELDLVSNEQDVKFLIISNYLDIYSTSNQLKVLEQNKVLAEQLHTNIKKLYEQNMVTRNELIRAELVIQNIKQSILVTKNDQEILSNQLSYALGLASNTLIVPTDTIDSSIIVQSKAYYIKLALEQNDAIQKAQMNVRIANKRVDIQKSNWFPTVSATGGYSMERPITSTTPVVDMYSNSWHAGLSLSYNVDNLYKNKRQLTLSTMQLKAVQESLIYAQQNVEIAVNTAFIKYHEAEQQTLIMNDAKRLANENYEIVRAKYLNQLAITADMTDAGNSKLNAELNYTAANIKTLYNYYNLLRAAGIL